MVGAAEERPDHRAGEVQSPASSVSSENTRNRKSVLVDGLKELAVDPSALRTLEAVFRQNSDLDEKRFNELLTEASASKEKPSLSAQQVEGFRKLFSDALAGVGQGAGAELSEAIRAVISETRTAPAKAKARSTEIPKELLATQAKILESLDAKSVGRKDSALTPEALQELIKSLSSQQSKQATLAEPQESSLLSELGVLGALRDLFGKEKEDRGSDGDRTPLPNRGFELPKFPERRGADRDRDKPEHKPTEPPARRERNVPSSQNSTSGDEKKEEAKKAPEKTGGESFVPKKKKPETDDEKKDTDPKESAVGDANGLLNSPSAAPAPKKSPLQPIPGGGAGMGGMDPFSAGNGGMGAGLGGGMGSGMPMGGGGSPSAPSMAADGDPFSSIGGGFDGGQGPGPAGAYSMVRDAGYGPGGGGGSDEGGSASEQDEGIDDQPTYGPAKLPTFSAQVINPTSNASTPPLFMLQKYVGFTGKGLCESDEAKKTIGICQARESKRENDEWWRKMESIHGPIRGG